MRKRLLGCLLALGLSCLSTFGQQADDSGGIWRITKFGPAAMGYTVIADLDSPATYEVCFRDAKGWFGMLSPAVDGGAYAQTLNPGSCMVIRGKNIGLVLNNRAPTKSDQFHGTYRRIDPAITWSSALNWGYALPANRPNGGYNSFPISLGAGGYFRVCQKILVVDGAPWTGYTVGYHLRVDDVPVQLRLSANPLLVRYDQGSCVDVDGKNIQADVIASEIDPALSYKPEGKFHYALLGGLNE